MIDFDAAHKEFNEFCAEQTDCKECFNRYKWEDNDASGCFKEFLKKRETPQKPFKAIDRSWGIEKEIPVCPRCDYYLTPFEFFGESKKKITYCEICGQPIDWSDEE